MSNWTAQDIVRWHKEALSKTTAEEQLRKVADEALEYYTATTNADRMEEMADVLIAATVLWRRYGEPLGAILETWRPVGVSDAEVKAAINAKMDINAERTWKGNQHVENKNAVFKGRGN